MAIIKELQKVAPFGRIENRQPPVVEDEELNATDGFEQAAIADSGALTRPTSNTRTPRASSKASMPEDAKEAIGHGVGPSAQSQREGRKLRYLALGGRPCSGPVRRSAPRIAGRTGARTTPTSYQNGRTCPVELRGASRTDASSTNIHIAVSRSLLLGGGDFAPTLATGDPCMFTYAPFVGCTSELWPLTRGLTCPL